MNKSLLAMMVLLVGAGAMLLVLVLRKTPPAVPVLPEANSLTIASVESVEEPRPDFPEPPPEAIVFDMHYEGLTSADEKLAYNGFYGYGKSSGDDTSFIQAVRQQVEGDVVTVYNPAFGPAQWSALEVREDKPVAFYFDLNADGRLSDDEKILPEKVTSNPIDFYTPDFLVHKDDGRLLPFRAFVRVFGSRFSCMWSPACVLKGTAEMAGERATLFLYCESFSGAFTHYGRSSFMLRTAEDGQTRDSRYPLSRLICVGDEFYELSVHGSHEKDNAVRVVLMRDTTPTGELAVAMAGQSDLKTRLTSANITGAEGDDIHFRISGPQTSLPAGKYVLSRGTLEYSAQENPVWRVGFSEGPEIAIEAGRTCTPQLGRPELAVSAIDARKQYSPDAKEATSFAKGTTVCLTPKIKGQAGEIYTRFSQVGADGRQSDVAPKIRILDPDGKEIVSENIDYG